MWFEQMHPTWQRALADYKNWLDQTETKMAGVQDLAPEFNLVMSAFTDDPADIAVVILGQDPYPGKSVAIGYAFAVAAGSGSKPASLRNIFKELESDLGEQAPNQTLGGWRQQGVFLLNRNLTTLQTKPGSHLNLGWQQFTDAAIAYLLRRDQYLVLVLWGVQAQKIQKTLQAELLLAGARISIIRGPHPSPLSAHRGFFGSKPFSAVNESLKKRGLQPIDWNR